MWGPALTSDSGAKTLETLLHPYVGKIGAALAHNLLRECEAVVLILPRVLIVAAALFLASRILRYAFFVLTCRIRHCREAPILDMCGDRERVE